MNHAELLDEIKTLRRVRPADDRVLWDLIGALVLELHTLDRRIEHLERHIRPEVN